NVPCLRAQTQPEGSFTQNGARRVTRCSRGVVELWDEQSESIPIRRRIATEICSLGGPRGPTFEPRSSQPSHPEDVAHDTPHSDAARNVAARRRALAGSRVHGQRPG